jgi:hypothetical protein
LDLYSVGTVLGDQRSNYGQGQELGSLFCLYWPGRSEVQLRSRSRAWIFILLVLAWEIRGPITVKVKSLDLYFVGTGLGDQKSNYGQGQELGSLFCWYWPGRSEVQLRSRSRADKNFVILTFLSGSRVTQSLVLCVGFVYRSLSFCTFFLLAIVLSVLLPYTDSAYPFGIFKLFLLSKK